MLLDDRFAEFLETCQGQSESSRRNYTQRLRSFLEDHGRKPAAAVTPADVNAWQRHLKARNLAPATLSGYRQALKALLNYCVEVGDIARSPAAHLTIGSFASSRADKLPVEEDVQRVTDLALRWVATTTPQRIRDGLIWLLSFHSGPRLGEIRNLLLSDVSQALKAGPDEYGVFRVPSTGKTGHVHIRFAGHVADAFAAWLDARPPSPARECFVTTRPPYRPLTRSAATHIYESICDAAGVKPAILSHALRHRLGDQTSRQFGPKVAAILLNHRDWQNPTTAIAFYHHPDEADASRAIVGSRPHDHGEEIALMRRLFGLDGR